MITVCYRRYDITRAHSPYKLEGAKSQQQPAATKVSNDTTSKIESISNTNNNNTNRVRNKENSPRGNCRVLFASKQQ